jgi:hypothetical protein
MALSFYSFIKSKKKPAAKVLEEPTFQAMLLIKIM